MLAGTLALALVGLAAVAQADQSGPGSQDPLWEQMADHHRQVAGEDWSDEMAEMMEEVHGADADELEGHWDEMSEWMDGLGGAGYGVEDMDEMMEDVHGTGFGPGMHGTDGARSEGHCGGGFSLQA